MEGIYIRFYEMIDQYDLVHAQGTRFYALLLYIIVM